MKKLTSYLFLIGVLVTQVSSVYAVSEPERLLSNSALIETRRHVVGSCNFYISDMFGGHFDVDEKRGGESQSGVYYLPIAVKFGFLSGGFPVDCVEATEERRAVCLNGKFEGGRWWQYGPVDGPEFVPIEEKAKPTTIPLKGKNWIGIAYTEDATTGDEQKRDRRLHFYLPHGAHALCGSVAVKWLADPKRRNDLSRIKAILKSVEFIDASDSACAY